MYCQGYDTTAPAAGGPANGYGAKQKGESREWDPIFFHRMDLQWSHQDVDRMALVAFLVCFLLGYGAPDTGAVAPSTEVLGPIAGAEGPGSAVKGGGNGGKHTFLFFYIK